MLSPKRTLHRKQMKGRMKGVASRGNYMAFGEFGKGRACAFMSDCAPHWGPPEFVNWDGYDKLWKGIADYLTEKR